MPLTTIRDDQLASRWIRARTAAVIGFFFGLFVYLLGFILVRRGHTDLILMDATAAMGYGLLWALLAFIPSFVWPRSLTAFSLASPAIFAGATPLALARSHEAVVVVLQPFDLLAFLCFALIPSVMVLLTFFCFMLGSGGPFARVPTPR